MGGLLRASVCPYLDEAEPMIRLSESKSRHVRLKRDPPQHDIVSTDVKGPPFCNCCAGDKDVLDVIIGWKRKEQPGYADIASGVVIAMCETCRYRLAHILEDS